MYKCPKCGQVFEGEARYCPNCGQPFVYPAADEADKEPLHVYLHYAEKVAEDKAPDSAPAETAPAAEAPVLGPVIPADPLCEKVVNASIKGLIGDIIGFFVGILAMFVCFVCDVGFNSLDINDRVRDISSESTVFSHLLDAILNFDGSTVDIVNIAVEGGLFLVVLVGTIFLLAGAIKNARRIRHPEKALANPKKMNTHVWTGWALIFTGAALYNIASVGLAALFIGELFPITSYDPTWAKFDPMHVYINYGVILLLIVSMVYAICAGKKIKAIKKTFVEKE